MDSTCRAASLQIVLDNYEVVLSVWTESQEGHLDSDIKTRVTGVEAQMLTFDFFWSIIGCTILRHSDNLSKSLQHHEHMSATEGQELVKLMHEVLQSLRKPEQFQFFYISADFKTSGQSWCFTSHSVTKALCNKVPADWVCRCSLSSIS